MLWYTEKVAIGLWPRQRVKLVHLLVLHGGTTLESMGKPLLGATKENVSENSKYKQFLRFWVVVRAERICGGSACGDDGKLTTSILPPAGEFTSSVLGSQNTDVPHCHLTVPTSCHWPLREISLPHVVF